MSDAGEEQPEVYEPYDSKTFPKASEVRNIASLSKDDLNLKNAAFQRTKGVNRMWSVAESCPLFRKPSGVGKTDKSGKKKKKKDKAQTRINRVLNSHTVTTLASGAAGNAAAVLFGETQDMRLDTVAETTKYPILHPWSKACTLMLTKALAAYCGEAFANAVAIKEVMGKHSKVTVRSTLAGTNILHKKLAGATALVPPKMAVRLPPPRAASKPKKAKM